MNTVKNIICVLILCLVALAAETIPLVDKSDPGSPIENEGIVTLTEWTADGKAFMSMQSDWKSTNISQKPILALMETMRVQYANGHSESVTQEHDAFFHPRTVSPGEVLPMVSGPAGTKVIDEKYSKPATPVCEVAVRWVQFADGTVFGDEKYAQHLLELRKGIWGVLAHLNEVYTTKGAEEFLKELNKGYPDPHVDGYIEHLRRFQNEHTTDETYQRVQEHLRMAEQRSKMVR